MTAGHGVDCRDAVEQRRLAGTGGSHDPDELPFLHLEADILDRPGNASFIAVNLFNLFYP